jgi:hypothetical protein
MLTFLILTAAGVAYAQEAPATLASTHYYIFSLGEISADSTTIANATQSDGYSVIQYIDNLPDGDLDTTLSAQKMLLIDGERFYLRQVEDGYAFTVRPSAAGYELVVNPSEDVALTDALGSILATLQSIGMVGDEVNLEYEAFSKADLKGPAAPEGVFLESTLYGLMVAEDWFAYASLHGLTLVGLRVEVVAEKLPGAALESLFSPFVSEESESLAKLLLPIDQLIALASSASVGYVRTAYQPAVP